MNHISPGPAISIAAATSGIGNGFATEALPGVLPVGRVKLEASLGGKQPIALESGEKRRFLERRDEVLMRVRARRQGFASIGFGECRGVVQPGRMVV